MSEDNLIDSFKGNYDNSEIIDIIPAPTVPWSLLEGAERDACINYLQNPCVMVMNFIDDSNGTLSEYNIRFALSLIGRGGNIGFKGIDFDVIGSYTLEEIINGMKSSNNPNLNSESLKYIGRLNEIENSNNPPKRQNLFKFEINYQILGIRD